MANDTTADDIFSIIFQIRKNNNRTEVDSTYKQI